MPDRTGPTVPLPAPRIRSSRFNVTKCRRCESSRDSGRLLRWMSVFSGVVSAGRDAKRQEAHSLSGQPHYIAAHHRRLGVLEQHAQVASLWVPTAVAIMVSDSGAGTKLPGVAVMAACLAGHGPDLNASDSIERASFRLSG